LGLNLGALLLVCRAVAPDPPFFINSSGSGQWVKLVYFK
jgi:hypothetical protein